MTRRVVLVVGPPAAGKSTWVAKRARRGDLVIDFDTLARAAGSDDDHRHPPEAIKAAVAEQKAQERAVAAMQSGTAYVIRTASDPATRAVIASRIGATEVQVVDPGRRTVERRFGDRPDSARREIERWYQANT